jgi:hypothetical protein
VDKFHYWANHKCSELCCLDRYPDSMIDFVNSSSAESLNSFLDNFKSVVAYMGQKMAMQFLYTILGLRNKELADSLQEEIDWAKF